MPAKRPVMFENHITFFFLRYCHTMSLVDGNPAVFGGYEDLFVPAEVNTN